MTVRADIPVHDTDPTGHAIWVAVYAAMLGASMHRYHADEMGGREEHFDAAIKAANLATGYARRMRAR